MRSALPEEIEKICHHNLISDSTLTLPHIQRCLEDMMQEMDISAADAPTSGVAPAPIRLWSTLQPPYVCGPRIAAGIATFLVKVKAHQGEQANEEADILADTAISDPQVGKEWCQRTNRTVFTWKKPGREARKVSYQDRHSTFDDDDCFYYHSWRNNVVIASGTLSSFLT